MGVTREQLTQLIRLVALGVWHPDPEVRGFARSVAWQLQRRLRALTLLEALSPAYPADPITVYLDPATCAQTITALDHALASYSHPSNRVDIVAWQLALDLAIPGET